MKLLQFTDTHLYGKSSRTLRGVEPYSSLRSMVQQAFASVPDFDAILVTGDLVQDDPSGYARFAETFAQVGKPVLCIPGNHDDPMAMRSALARAPFQVGGVWRAQAWQIILLDSVVPGEVGGRLSDAELERLEAALSASPAYALVCLHHHPVPMGSLWLDSVGLAEADDFWRVIDAHDHVRGVSWGHVHQAAQSVRGPVQLLATPSTCSQFLPFSDQFAIDDRPPAFRSYVLHADGRLETQVEWAQLHSARRAAG